MEREIIDYDLIFSTDHKDFVHKVNEKLKEGWQLYGSHQIQLSPNTSKSYSRDFTNYAFSVQMVKYK